jgi:hypothetical protein
MYSMRKFEKKNRELEKNIAEVSIKIKILTF